MREKSAHCPRRGFEPVSLGYAPIVLPRLHRDGRHASCVCVCVCVCVRASRAHAHVRACVCARARVCVVCTLCVTMKRKCQMNGKHNKR